MQTVEHQPWPSEEQEWADLLAGLAPWDLHTLMRNELHMHDEYVAGLLNRDELLEWIWRAQGRIVVSPQVIPA